MAPEGYGLRPETTGETKAGYWRCAFGLQRVDGLEPSVYARGLAERNVRGEISLAEAESLLNDHYAGGGVSTHEEADKVSQRIVALLERGWFQLDPYMLTYIHRELFRDLDEAIRPGEYKDDLYYKCEPILNGDSVLYAAPEALDGMLAAHFAREGRHEYATEADGSIGRMTYFDLDTLASFVSMVWMNHPFMDGNTRTTATFLILYLRSMGFDVDNTLFETEALYFRGALVRACYQNGRAGVRPTREYLDLFLSKLLEDPEARLDHDSLWCREMFRHPDLIRNADPGAARVMQERLREEGVTKRVLGLGH